MFRCFTQNFLYVILSSFLYNIHIQGLFEENVAYVSII